MTISVKHIVGREDTILVTGASGFIGHKVVEKLLERDFGKVRCLVRSPDKEGRLRQVLDKSDDDKAEVIYGNLLSTEDCQRAADGVSVVYHLAAGADKSFAGAFLNSVVTTRNLLEAARQSDRLKRFVNVSSFAVYSNRSLRRGALLDETCPIEQDLPRRCDPYVYGKARQDALVMRLCREYGIPYVIVRPGAVYGPGSQTLTSRVGVGTFGIFLHLGGVNRLPLTYVDNCADAIVLAGLAGGVEGEVFNIVDDELPTSRQFLKLYKNKVVHFKSLYVPYPLFSLFCLAWESYSRWSRNQLPPIFNPLRCAAYWKGNRYSNEKLKQLLGWHPDVAFSEGSELFFASLKGEK